MVQRAAAVDRVFAIMNGEALRASINRYIDTAYNQAHVDEHQARARLAQALDELVQQYNATTYCDPDDGPDAPRSEHEVWVDLYKRAGSRFPGLGYYADVEPNEDTAQQVTLGDAIDDIADIARDLIGVLWYLDQDRLASAVWEYRFNYECHWGDHLHRLRRVLHRALHY
jgi:Domain of unknown function (DUF5063)